VGQSSRQKLTPSSGFFYHESTFQVTGAQASSSLMTLACITLILPAACEYHSCSTANQETTPRKSKTPRSATSSKTDLLTLPTTRSKDSSFCLAEHLSSSSSLTSVTSCFSYAPTRHFSKPKGKRKKRSRTWTSTAQAFGLSSLPLSPHSAPTFSWEVSMRRLKNTPSQRGES
jgi:hypothetical protein